MFGIALNLVVTSEDPCVRDTVASRALAAAEVVASWLGRPPNGGEELEKWTRRHSNFFTPSLVKLARQAVEVIKTRSEIRKLWTDPNGEVRREWLNGIADLELRLQDAPK